MRRYSPSPVRQTPSTRDAFRVFLPLALPFAILAGFAVFAVLTPDRRASVSGPGQPGALVWGDAIFANRTQLRAWLAQHGGSYPAWLRQHPAAKHLLVRRPVTARRAGRRAAIAARSATAKRHEVMRPPTGKVNPAPASAQRVTGRRSVGMSFVFAIFAALGLLGAALPRRFIQRIGLSGQIAEVRLGMALVGAAILCGVALALL